MLSTDAGKAAAMDSATVQGILEYHILNGTFPASMFTAANQFIPTLLTNSTITNITGGQVVDGVLNGKNVELFSGLKEKATVATAVSYSSPCKKGRCGMWDVGIGTNDDGG